MVNIKLCVFTTIKTNNKQIECDKNLVNVHDFFSEKKKFEIRMAVH